MNSKPETRILNPTPNPEKPPSNKTSHNPEVGLLLMVRIVDFYRKRMQQRKAGLGSSSRNSLSLGGSKLESPLLGNVAIEQIYPNCKKEGSA